jgi:hypothetical protein
MANGSSWGPRLPARLVLSYTVRRPIEIELKGTRMPIAQFGQRSAASSARHLWRRRAFTVLMTRDVAFGEAPANDKFDPIHQEIGIRQRKDRSITRLRGGTRV